MPLINLAAILEYIGVGVRPLVEGEAVLNAGHVIMCGLKSGAAQEVFGLCLQTSYLSGAPHEINVDLNGSLPKDWKCICSCKAGAGGKCKHIVAVLLFVNRNELQHISSTERAQIWGKRKINQTAVAEPIEKYCHVQDKKVRLNVSSVFIQDTHTWIIKR